MAEAFLLIVICARPSASSASLPVTTIIATVSDPVLSPESAGSIETWSKAGVMIRSTLDANSSHAMIIVSGAHAVSMQRRPVTGGVSSHNGIDNPGPTGAATYLKMVRQGTQFTGFYATEPGAWVQLGPAVTVSMPTRGSLSSRWMSSESSRCICSPTRRVRLNSFAT